MKYDAIANRVNQASGKETKSSHKTGSEDIHTLVLDTVAWAILPVEANSHILSDLRYRRNLSTNKINVILNELAEQGKLIQHQENGKVTYRLPDDDLLRTLIRFVEEGCSMESFSPLLYMSMACGKMIYMMHSYINTDTYTTSVRILASPHISPELADIVHRLVQHESWLPFLKSMRPEMLDALYYSRFDWHFAQLREISADECSVYINSAKLQRTRELYELNLLFYTQLMQGNFARFTNIAGITDDTKSNSFIYIFGLATIAAYCGNFSAAYKLFSEITKHNKLLVFDNAFVALVYVWTLYKTGTPQATKKLTAIANNNDNYPVVVIASLISNHLLNNNTTEAVKTLLNNDIVHFNPLDKAIALIVVGKLNMADAFDKYTPLVDELCKSNQYRLIQLELMGLCNPEAQNDIAKSIGIEPLIPTMRKTENWEKLLNKLLDRTSNAEIQSLKQKEKVKLSRIVYLVDNCEITPVEQKSNDGIAWSKGRKIALLRFKEGLPDMNDTDNALRHEVEVYGDHWSIEYTLGNAHAFHILAGYPLVFLKSDPTKPVEIVCELPELEVKKEQKHYVLKCNFDCNSDEEYRLEVCSDTRYKVMRITKEQMALFNGIDFRVGLPEAATPTLKTILPKLAQFVTVHSDLVTQNETLEQHNANSGITALIQPYGDEMKIELVVKPLPAAPTYCTPGCGNTSIIGIADGKRVQAVRNMESERTNMEQVQNWLSEAELFTDTNVYVFDSPYQTLEALNILGQHLDSVNIEWPKGAQITICGNADFDNLNLNVTGSVGQWFEIDGTLKINADVMLKMADLLRRVRQSKGRFIELDNNQFIALTEKLRKQLLAIDAIISNEKGKLRIPSLTAPTLGAVEELGAHLKTNKAFLEMKQRIEQSELMVFDVPKGLNAELRQYQTKGFEWMSRLAEWGAGACLADDMGLGKTVQSTALLLNRAKHGPSLVVAPASVVTNWQKELQRFAPQLNALLLNTANIDRHSTIGNAQPFDVIITTYGLLANEVETIAQKQWNIAILDEAHTIKNKETKMSKAAMKINAGFRLLLTGTPIQNRLSELWSLFNFATPGLLGSFQSFADRFITPIESHNDKAAQLRLKNILKPFLLRRTKTDVLDELPPKTEVTIQVDLSDEERAIYENIRIDALKKLETGENTTIQTLAEITRLRQAACNPRLIDKSLNITSSKTEAFIKLTNQLIDNNHRALVFSQFTSHLDIIRQQLDSANIKYLYLDGSTTVAKRKKLVTDFQTGQTPLFLISLKAGGLGLNLTAADYVIHLDPWWNPAIEDQASDRAYRIGQIRPVTVYRLIAENTIEEKILRLHSTKKNLADSLLEGTDIAHRLTKEEMLELLSNSRL